MKKYIIFAIIFSFLSCNEPKDPTGGAGYLKDSTISTKEGVLLDSRYKHLPNKLYLDSGWIYFYDSKDSGKLMQYRLNNDKVDNDYYINVQNPVESKADFISTFNVPILYNYYTGTDIYRFIYGGSFHRPVMLIVKKDKEKITLNVKNAMFDRSKSSVDSYKLIITSDTTVNLTLGNWHELEKLILENNLMSLVPPYYAHVCVDGDYGIFEGHIYDKYYCAIRSDDSEGIGKCVEYIFNLRKDFIDRRYGR